MEPPHMEDQHMDIETQAGSHSPGTITHPLLETGSIHAAVCICLFTPVSSVCSDLLLKRKPCTDSVITPERKGLVSPKSAQNYFFSFMFCCIQGRGEWDWWLFFKYKTKFIEPEWGGVGQRKCNEEWDTIESRLKNGLLIIFLSCWKKGTTLQIILRLKIKEVILFHTKASWWGFVFN